MNGIDVDVKLKQIALENHLRSFATSNGLEMPESIIDTSYDNIILRFVRHIPGGRRGIDLAVRYEYLLGDINHLADIIIRDVTRELLGWEYESRR